MKFEIDQKLIEDGYITKRKHPECDYFIYNYTAKTQYEGYWNYQTLNCRGLILDGEGNIIARPFPKFFNYEEYGEGSKLGRLITYKSFEITEKLDGSLGILYRMPNGEWRIATRGSFESEQAKVGTELLKKNIGYMNGLMDSHYSKDKTYLYEIIYPENRIVVDYKKARCLVLLAIVDNETGKEASYWELKLFGQDMVWHVVDLYEGINDFRQVREMVKRTNAEGFVVKLDDGTVAGTRVKLKYEEYVRLHRLITGVSTKSIWDLLRNGQDMNELLDRVPDEFYEWVSETKNQFEQNYKSIEHSCKVIVAGAKFDTRKKVAKYFLDKPNKIYSGVCFAMYDEKPYEHIIWKLLRPAYSKPFMEEV